jgi:hypothetical protein
MPTTLRRRGFLTLLYALRAVANANGELRFHGDRKAIRIQDIAKAAGASEKDARRYLNAAVAAGVVGVRGEQRRGRSSLYVLLMCPNPLWGAAEDSLKSSRRAPGKTPPPWKDDPNNPGIAMELPQEMADLVEQPPVGGRPGPTDLDQSQGRDSPDGAPLAPTRCAGCGGGMFPRGRPRTHCHACERPAARESA